MMEWTVQGGGRVTVPGGVREKTGCGAMVGLTRWCSLIGWTRSSQRSVPSKHSAVKRSQMLG